MLVVTKPFYDQYTQKAYTKGQSYTPDKAEHADSLVRSGHLQWVEQENQTEEDKKPKSKRKKNGDE